MAIDFKEIVERVEELVRRLPYEEQAGRREQLTAYFIAEARAAERELSVPKCGTCRAFSQRGTCRKNPPVIVSENSPARWPDTDDTDWCLQHEAAQE